jgi:hypothetical protein
MVKLLAATAVITLAAMAAARADTVYLDPLHLCADVCTSFNGVTLGNSANQNFGIASSPASQVGDLTLVVLVPNNVALSAPSFTGTQGSGSFTGSAGFVGTFMTGQDLTNVLGAPFAGATPPNPFSAYIGATQALDPGATSYNVFKITFTSPLFTTGANAGQQPISKDDNSFDLDQGCVGCIITAFLDETVTGGSGGGVFTTAQSSALVTTSNNAVPLPAALPLFATGFGGILWALRRQRKDKFPSPPVVVVP